MNFLGNKLTFKQFSVFNNKWVRILGWPLRQDYVVHFLSILLCSKIKILKIDEELRQKEKFGNQFSDISRASSAVLIGFLERMKKAIANVEFIVL